MKKKLKQFKPKSPNKLIKNPKVILACVGLAVVGTILLINSRAAGYCDINPGNNHLTISNAIAACANGTTVRFPAGVTYTLTDSIVVENRSNLVIDGNGSTFQSTAPNTAVNGTANSSNWRIDSGTNVVLQNLKIIGNFPDGPRGIVPGNQLNHGVMVRGGNGVTVRDSTITNVYGDGVVTTRSGWVLGNSLLGVAPQNTRFQRLTIKHAARMCVAFTEQIGGWLEDSNLSECHYGGVDLETDVGRGQYTSNAQVLRDIHILRNNISTYYIMGIGVAGPVEGMGVSDPGDLDNIEVRGNTIGVGDTCWPAVLFSDPDYNRGPISNIIISDNTLTAQGNVIGINDIVGGTVTNNKTTSTHGIGWCGNIDSVRMQRSTGVNVSNNSPTASGATTSTPPAPAPSPEPSPTPTPTPTPPPPSSSTLTAPTNLTGNRVSASRIDLSWGASSGPVLYYHIWRNNLYLGSVHMNEGRTTYSDATVSSTSNYTYFVRAEDSGSNTKDSNTITIGPSSAPAPAPAPAPNPCANKPLSDVNCDGTVNAIDISSFRQKYKTKEVTADLNGDGAINAVDISTFRQQYKNGT